MLQGCILLVVSTDLNVMYYDRIKGCGNEE